MSWAPSPMMSTTGGAPGAPGAPSSSSRPFECAVAMRPIVPDAWPPRIGWITVISSVERTLDLVDHVRHALGVGGPAGARLALAHVARVRDEQLRVRRRAERLVVGQRHGVRHVLDVLAEQRLAAGPAPLSGPALRVEAVERPLGEVLLVLAVGLLDAAVGEPVLDELLDAEQPLLLVVRVASQVELQHVLDPAVVGHVVDAAGHQAALRLG